MVFVIRLMSQGIKFIYPKVIIAPNFSEAKRIYMKENPQVNEQEGDIVTVLEVKV